MAIAEWKRRCLGAVAEKQLPVLPGDYILFNFSGARLLVIIAMPGSTIDSLARGEPTMGQDLVGLMWRPDKGSTLTNYRLDWSGVFEFWTIHRTTV